MILVVGILAMLFIVGSTLLIVSRFERQNVQTFASGKGIEAVAAAVTEPVITSAREDVVGKDGTPYNRGWNMAAELSPMEDYADFPGLGSSLLRSGDFLLSSVEPYLAGKDTNGNKVWRLFAASWPVDGVSTVGEVPNAALVRNLAVGLTRSPKRDADGDGLLDSHDPDTSSMAADVIGMFGGSYLMDLRVIGHGGMVRLDRQTHPALLAQVIHKADAAAANPSSLFLGPKPVVLGATDEAALRRRFMLPKNLVLADLSDTDVRKQLPATLGYASYGSNSIIQNLTPHWWPVDDTVVQGDNEWWQLRLTPSDKGMAETGYDPNSDYYDRRHLITAFSSDDVLRPNRDEARLRQVGLRTNVAFKDHYAMLYYVLNPDPAGGADPDLPAVSRLPMSAVGRVGDVVSRMPGDALEFNTSSLRTAFSLRDVLDPRWDDKASPNRFTAEPSYRRVEQLMAYYLAMIQHTTVPGTDFPNGSLNAFPGEDQLRYQLRTAAQLAVNTIDFADDDTEWMATAMQGAGIAPPLCPRLQASTYFEWPLGNPVVKVLGVEKQPYITEAYAKIITKAAPSGTTGFKWSEEPDANDESIYAVEIYNPYDEALSLVGLEIQVVGQDSSLISTVDLGTVVATGKPATTGMIQPYSYLVIANRSVDVATGKSFIPTAKDDVGQPGAVLNANLFIASNFAISAGGLVQLVRNEKQIAKVRPATEKNPGYDYFTTGLSMKVVIDEMRQLDMENAADAGLLPGVSQSAYGQWAAQWDTKEVPAPTSLSDRLVRDTSLQRPKEVPFEAPQYWYFTLGRQILFPLPDYENLEKSGALNPPLGWDAKRKPQHNLLGTHPMLLEDFASTPIPVAVDPLPYGHPSNTRCDNQWLAWREALGVQLGDPAGGEKAFRPFEMVANYYPVTVAFPEKPALAPFPIVTSDRGVDPATGGCLAFPTTGTLLMVTRYAHEMRLGTTPRQVPVTAAATELPALVPGDGRLLVVLGAPATVNPGQLQQVDNGHLPVFDTGQNTTDLTYKNVAGNEDPQGRLSQPWGRLVYEYFTALPMEELVRPLPLETLNAGAADGTRLTDAPDYPASYSVVFAARSGGTNGPLQASYPRMDLAEGATSLLGPKVSGRINVNLAPWWVLDGLPTLPDALPGDNNAIPTKATGALAGLPVVELQSERLDPPGYALSERAGVAFVRAMIDEAYNVDNPPSPLTKPNAPPLGLPSLSANLARHMVGYRENRSLQDSNGNVMTPATNTSGEPGFVSVGALFDVITSIKLSVHTDEDGGKTKTDTIGNLRRYQYLGTASDLGTAVRPFAYVGYLQLVAPMVRLQDWATVKSHVFTIYAGIGDAAAGQPIWLRTQVTVDRTRCLYSNDLPERITETAPIGYYNAVDD